MDMKQSFVHFFAMTLLAFALLPAIAGEAYCRDYALLGKSLDDDNFSDTVTGCNQAAQTNKDRCFLIGARGPADARRQALSLKTAARARTFSGFAVSVILSDAVAKVVRQEVRVPVISFDSPFESKDAAVSRGYVGIDNVAFGRDMARAAKRFRPGGGTLFLMGDLHDANLARRIAGGRRELSGQEDYPAKKRLAGEKILIPNIIKTVDLPAP